MKIRLLTAVLVLLIGAGLLIYPHVHSRLLSTQLAIEAASFTPAAVESAVPYEDLLSDMTAYNQVLNITHQSGFADLSSCEEPSFLLSDYGLSSEVFAVLDIPSLGLHMPVYLGASEEHLSQGAAILSQTSLPIGGSSTNSVIAGHRGYQGADYFRYVPDLSVGDEVILTTQWGEQHYKVCEKRVIEPYDTDAVLIQPERELITLLTCHPYASGGRYRCAVYCERSDIIIHN